MASKGKFLYILPSGDNYRVLVRGSDFADYPDGTKFTLDYNVGLPLGKMSTDDLLKVKAQIASELENRMDLDDVTEANLERLQTTIAEAETSVIAHLMRQTLDRLDTIGADEKRAKTRLQILENHIKHRMLQDGVSELKVEGAVQVTYKSDTVYSVGEAGWDSVYTGILAKIESGQSPIEAFSILQKRLTSTTLNELVKQGEELPQGIESQQIQKIKVKRTK